MQNNVYEAKFYKFLTEDLGLNPDLEKNAMAQTLDDETDPSEFDVSQEVQSVDKSVEQAISAREQQMIKTISDWIGQMEKFRDFLNGPHNNSIQKALSNAESETILDKMRNAEQRKIARVATELAALIESFKGYLAQTGNANLKYV
jgi:hypothetical protein